MDKERLIELNEKYGELPTFQELLAQYLKNKFKSEEMKKERRLQNV